VALRRHGDLDREASGRRMGGAPERLDHDEIR
jgi:hypothetical protein